MKYPKRVLTQADLKENLYYDPETGLFTWLIPAQRRRLTKEAGHKSSDGYTHVFFRGTLYRAHRLAWFYVHGEFPVGFLGHINGDRSDNRIENLRVADNFQNSHNAQIAANNATGFKGVSYCKTHKKYRAQCAVNKVNAFLGYFDTPEEASAAYEDFAREHHADFYYGHRYV